MPLRSLAATSAIAAALIYSVVHFVTSGVIYPTASPNVGQVIEELQPLYRLFTAGVASVDHPRQYGPVFLMLFHPVYQRDLVDPTLLAWYAYALDLTAIAIGFVATVFAIRKWASARGRAFTGFMVLCLAMLWANFSPLYGVLAIKNVELWELACICVGGAALLYRRDALAGWAIAAGALIKMLPLVFLPYLLLRHRRAFVHALVGMAVILSLSQALYGTQMGFGYFKNMFGAASSAQGFGNPQGMIWHENVSIRGLMPKAFGYLEDPYAGIPNRGYSRGFYVVVPPTLRPYASIVTNVIWGLAALWTAWALLRRFSDPEPSRSYWDWALVGIMMLILAPQISQDYMVLTLGAFSFVLAGCLLAGRRAPWVDFALATLLVGNVLPRGLFSRLLLIDPAMQWSGHEHLMRAEAYQYFGFPLLGLLLLTRAWDRLVRTEPPASGHVY